MPGFDKDEFWVKILSMYPEARENNYLLKLNPEQVQELKAMFIEHYIPMEKLHHYDDVKLMREMMRTIVSIYKLDKDAATNHGDLVELVNSVNYDGKYLYLHYAKISPIKMRRFELGKSMKQIAERMGYSVTTIRNCEEFYCDFNRQPENLVFKLAKALDWTLEEAKEQLHIW